MMGEVSSIAQVSDKQQSYSQCNNILPKEKKGQNIFSIVKVSTRVLSLNKQFLNIHKNRYEKQGQNPQNPPILVYHITYYILLGSKLKLHSVLYIDSKKLISTKSQISAILLFGLNIFVMVEASINSTGCQREQFSTEGVY